MVCTELEHFSNTF